MSGRNDHQGPSTWLLGKRGEGQHQRRQRLEVRDHDLSRERALVASDLGRGASIEDRRDMDPAGAGPLQSGLEPLQQLRDLGGALGELRPGSLGGIRRKRAESA